MGAGLQCRYATSFFIPKISLFTQKTPILPEPPYQKLPLLFSRIVAIDTNSKSVEQGIALCKSLGSNVLYKKSNAEMFDYRGFNVIFMAALVGRSDQEKHQILNHIRKYAHPGTLILVRSVDGARRLIYPYFDEAPPWLAEVGRVVPDDDCVINTSIIFRLNK